MFSFILGAENSEKFLSDKSKSMQNDINENEENESPSPQQWRSCCSRVAPAQVRYFSTLSMCALVMVLCSVQLLMHPHDLEVRAAYLPILSSVLMLFVDGPSNESSQN